MGFLTNVATAINEPTPTTSTSKSGFFGMSIQKIIDAIRQVTSSRTTTPAEKQVATGALNGIAQQLTPQDLTTNPGGPAELPTRQAVELPGIYQHQQDIADRLRAQFEPRFAGRFGWDGQLGALHAVQAHERNAARALAGLGGEGGGLPPVLPPVGDGSGGGGVAPPLPAPPPVGDGGSGGLPPLTPPPVMPPAGDGTLPPVAPPLPPVDTTGGGGSTTTPTSPLNQIASGPTAPAEPITAVAPPPSWSPVAPPTLAPITSTTVSPIAQPSASDAALLQYLAAMQPMTTPTGTSQLQFGYPSGDLAPLVTYDPVTGMMMLKEMAAAYNQ